MSSPARTYHHGDLRRALIDEGLQLARTGGPSAVTLREATRAAGVSPNAAYRHFTDRDALVRAVAREAQLALAGAITARVDATPAHLSRADAAIERLRRVGLAYIEFARTEPGWFEVAFSTIEPRWDASGEASLPPPLLLLVAALDALAASGELAVREGAEWPCWSAVHGFALLALHGPLRALEPDELWSAAERTVDDVITGLLARALVT